MISALWFSCNGAAQQIVKERPIYRRERMVNLRLDACLFSNLWPLMLLAALHVVFMLLTVWLLEVGGGAICVMRTEKGGNWYSKKEASPRECLF